VIDAKPAGIRGLQLMGAITILAGLYVLVGLLGLQLAVPPGYASIMWPASGIAIAALLIFSPRLAPGIFIGSLLVNAYVGGVLNDISVDWRALAVAVAIAAGSTLQATAAAWGARRLFGFPIVLKSIKDVAVFGGIVGPLACLIAATIGTLTLLVAGLMPATLFVSNWLTWWGGDFIGILVVLPLALLGPWRIWGAGWSRSNNAGLRSASIVALLVPLCMTFYGWKWTSEVAYERGHTAFHGLASDSEQALLHRMDSYAQGLDGAAGLFRASTQVTAADWRAYVDALNIRDTLPGINGIGIIDDVPTTGLADYYARVWSLGVQDLVVHPTDEPRENHFVIRYIEPIETNRPAVGLDIAFEDNRREAAETARQTGRATITKRIFLVQDEVERAGFLLLKPLYTRSVPLRTVEQRKIAFRGWAYAPFVGARLMEDLTSSQNATLELQVYDGPIVNEDRLIYSSLADDDAGGVPTYTIKETIPVMGQYWTIVWTSTAQFDGETRNNEPLFVLLAGLLVSGLFAIFLLSYARREQTISRQVVQKTREITAREQENRAVVSTAVVGILLLDEDGRLLSANEAALGIFGVRAEDVPHMSIRDLLKLEGEQGVAEILGAFLARTTRTKPATGVSRDGNRLDLEFQLNPWKTEDGQMRYTAIVRDVTLQRQITVALEDAEERWSSALRGARIGVFDVDLTTGQSIVSDTWLEMLGFALDDAVSPQEEWRKRVHPDDLPNVDAADAACFAGTTARSECEYRIMQKSGQWIWLRSDATVTQRDDAGRALRLVGTQTDITDLKEAEAALRSSEERLRSAIENAPIGMALVDPRGEWINVNEALLAFLGYEAEEFLKLHFRELAYPDDVGIDSEQISQLAAGEISDYQMEKRYLHKEGHAVWGLLSVSAARGADGSIDYYIAQIQDIQDRKEMDRIKSEFISNVSHELRTPLTSIRGSLGLVMGAMAKDIPESVTRLLSIAHKNSERLILLINDILDLEKMNSEKLQFEIGSHKLREEVVLAMETNQSYANQFDVKFVLDTPDIDMDCDFDPSRLQQVLSNLMSNAAKFSLIDGTVHLSLAKVGKMARVSVTDSGSGIPASFRNRIFSPFSQADASATRETGGTGLGLHISKQMMEKMFGTLEYSSVEGSGSTFWIDLPLTSTDSVSSSGHQDQGALAHLPRVLHVEDDKDFRDFIATALAGQLNIVQAESLGAARAQLVQNSFDVILLDLQLPDGNGMDLLEGLNLTSGCPVIVLTATETLDDDERVSVSMVKSRTPETKIVDIILEAAAAARRTQAKVV